MTLLLIAAAIMLVAFLLFPRFERLSWILLAVVCVLLAIAGLAGCDGETDEQACPEYCVTYGEPLPECPDSCYGGKEPDK